MTVATPTAPLRSRTIEAPPALIGGARVDVCIMGGGLAGMMAAYLLARERRSVMVLEEGPIGGAPAAAEVAHLASMIEQPYEALERIHGPAAARIAVQGYRAAIDAIEAIVHRERIACEFERLDGYRFPAPGDTRAEAEREAQAARRAGLEAEVVPAAPIEDSASGPCVRYPGQAQFHPQKFLLGLARAIQREGGRVHCGVRTRAIVPGRLSTVVTAGGHQIQSQVVVTPGGAPAAPRAANVIALRVPRGTITRALYWESSDRTRCARLRAGPLSGELLWVAGNDPAESLAAWARGHFPRAAEIVQRFSGELPQPADLFAITGRDENDSESMYVSASSWGSAMTRAVVGGMVIRDYVLGARDGALAADVPSDCYSPLLR